MPFNITGSECSAGIEQLSAGAFYPLNLYLFTRIRSKLKILILTGLGYLIFVKIHGVCAQLSTSFH